MSSIAVVGERYVFDSFMWNDPRFDQDARKKCGAYIVKFYVKGKPKYVIVDDILPYINKKYGERLLLGRSEDA